MIVKGKRGKNSVGGVNRRKKCGKSSASFHPSKWLTEEEVARSERGKAKVARSKDADQPYGPSQGILDLDGLSSQVPGSMAFSPVDIGIVSFVCLEVLKNMLLYVYLYICICM